MSRRRSTLVSTAVLAAGVGLLVPTSAHATGNACAGTGEIVVDSGLALPPAFSGPVDFTLSLDCVGTADDLTGHGTLTLAACGQSLGAGTIDGVGDFDIAMAGSMLAVTGALYGNTIAGSASAAPIPTATVPPGNSCSTGTAKVFRLVGAVHY